MEASLLPYCVVVFVLFFKIFPSWKVTRDVKRVIEAPKGDAVEDDLAKMTKYSRLSTWECLQYIGSMIFFPGYPNYEIIHNIHVQTGRKVSIIDLLLPKELIISVADLRVAKQIMSSAEWINRFRDKYYFFKFTWNKPYGLLFGGGEYWRQARALTLRIFHHLDFFKQENLEEMIKLEIDQVLKKLQHKNDLSGKEDFTLCPHKMFELAAINIISQACWSERFNQMDYFVTKVLPSGDRAARTFNVGFGVLELFPWLSVIPELTFYGAQKSCTEITVDYFKEVLHERRRSGVYRTQPKDFTDHFLLEMEKQTDFSVINEKAYFISMRDIVFAGIDTINSTLEHGILQMALNPQVQHKVQAEIDEIVGYSRGPVYADRARMTYTRAVLLETLRYSTPVPFTSRSNLADAQLSGNSIPKGSLCGINIYSIHRSKELWDDPCKFRPERFLGTEGQIINAEKIIPFGYGKRACIGESVAKTFLFLAFVSLLQQYEFRVSSSHPPPSLTNPAGVSRCPIPYHVNIRKRS